MRKTRDRGRKKGMERLVQGDIIKADRKGNERIDEWLRREGVREKNTNSYEFLHSVSL